MKVQQEFLATCWEDAQPLLGQHWEEALGGEGFCPDLSLYEVLEQVNALRIFTLRDEDELAGYVIFVINPSTHQAGRMLALCDGIYIRKKSRSVAAVRRLMAFSEACLRDDGVHEIRAHSNTGSSLGFLFQRFGYNLTETVHAKVL